MERKSTAVAGPVLEVKNLSVSFRMYDRGLEQYDLKVISNLNLDVRPGEIVAVAGSSGSGKSLLAHAVMGLLPENASVEGEISYGGKLLEQKDMERLRGKEFALVPQSVTFLDPSMKVGPQVTGPRPSRERRQRQREVFDRFHLGAGVHGGAQRGKFDSGGRAHARHGFGDGAGGSSMFSGAGGRGQGGGPHHP